MDMKTPPSPLPRNTTHKSDCDALILIGIMQFHLNSCFILFAQMSHLRRRRGAGEGAAAASSAQVVARSHSKTQTLTNTLQLHTLISKSKIQSISTQCTSTYMWAAVAAGLIHVVYIFLAWITCLRFDAITLLHFAAAVLARPACCCPTSGHRITLSHRNNVFSYKHQIQLPLRKCHIYGGGAGAGAAAAKSFIVVSKWVIVSYGLS